VFEKMHEQDFLLWNVMLRVYAKDGNYDETLQPYYEMQRNGISLYLCTKGMCRLIIYGREQGDPLSHKDNQT
jgi:pentatricopeptide repeat protein